MDPHQLIAAVPKAELHIHIEGSLEPGMMLWMARQNGLELPWKNEAEIRRAYAFTSLQDFLDLYYQGTGVLQAQKDFYDLTLSFLRRAAGDGIIYSEIFFDPQAHTDRGVPFDTLMTGLLAAKSDAREMFGIEAKLILCILRHLDADAAERTLDLALPYKHDITAVGLDSSEVGHPPDKFKNVFRRARDEGFSLTAHAGEEGPPEYVWQALDNLGVDRIDHGNRAMEDKELVRRLARDQVPLTLCPLSNLRLAVISDMAAQPVKQMLDAGLKATVNSDDPAYFGGYLDDNYTAVIDALALSTGDVARLIRNGFEAAFAGDAERAALLKFYDDAVANTGLMR